MNNIQEGNTDCLGLNSSIVQKSEKPLLLYAIACNNGRNNFFYIEGGKEAKSIYFNMQSATCFHERNIGEYFFYNFWSLK